MELIEIQYMTQQYFKKYYHFCRYFIYDIKTKIFFIYFEVRLQSDIPVIYQ